MILIRTSLLVLSLVVMTGCATRQEVLLAKAQPTKTVATVARVPDEGNSSTMDLHLEQALVAEGLQVRGALPAGTRKSGEVDAIVSYVDVWRWDLVMYLHSLNVKIFDAASGDLLVTGQWRDSAFHGFRDAKLVTQQLVSELLAKLRAAKP